MKKMLLTLLAGSAMLFTVSAAENLLKNGDFKTKKNWGFWQSGESKKQPSVCKLGDGKMEMQSLKEGCYKQNIPVQPGEEYTYTVTGSNTSKGTAQICLAFLTAKRKWLSFRKSAVLPASGKEETVSITVTVPEDAANMSVQLVARKQAQEDTGVITFTKAELLKK